MLQSEPSPLAKALSCWFAGDFDGCLIALDAQTEEDSTEGVILRARSLLRLERAAELIKLVTTHWDRFSDKDECATAAMLLGAGYAREHEFAHAVAEFNRARGYRPHKTILAETAYYNAVALYQLGDGRAARAILAEALDPSEDIVYVRALHLSGLLLAAEERFSDAGDYFEQALEALDRCRAWDLGLVARIVHMIAVSQAEGSTGDSARVLNLVNRVPWTSCVVDEHVQALRHVGLGFQRYGDLAQAAQCFATAALVSPESTLAAISFADLSWNALLGNEATSAAVFQCLCMRIVQLVDWRWVSGEARLALVEIAMLAARFGDGKQAQGLMDLFDERRGFSSVEGLSHDSRASTFERHARALVSGANGCEEYALRELREVDEAWSRIHYHWRAIDARVDMIHLRRDDALAESIARRRAELRSQDCVVSGESFPGSLVLCAPSAAEGYPVHLRLSDTQRAIVKLSVEGFDAREIAIQLGYQHQSIRKQFQKIYQIFDLGNPTRAKLASKILNDPVLKASLVS